MSGGRKWSYLRCQDVLITRPIQFLQSSAHLNLALAAGIYLGRVEHIDAIVPGSLQALFDNIALLRTTVSEPSTKRQYGNLQACRPEVAKDHVLGVISRADSHGGEQPGSWPEEMRQGD